MMKKLKLYLLLVVLFVVPSTGVGARPNIVLIMADDIAYDNNFGAYGARESWTPYLDRMAEEGMTFEHAYSTPKCTPSRVKLMTGRSGIRNYEGFGRLPATEVSFAQILQKAGYKTHVAGKWQLDEGGGTATDDAGFDSWFLWNTKLGRGSRYWEPNFDVNGEFVTYGKDDYGPDLCVRSILDFVEKCGEEPFLVYYPMLLVHGPFETTPDSEVRERKDAQENFKDMVKYMDKCVGRVLDGLKRLGVAENTVVLFCTDNGTNRVLTYESFGEVVDGKKGVPHDRGTHSPLIAWSPKRIPAGARCSDLIDFSDMLPTLAEIGGAKLPEVELDGRSFWPQCKGEKGEPRDWIFQYYWPKAWDWIPDELGEEELMWVQNQSYKLHRNGLFYNLLKDREELSPIPLAELTDQESRIHEVFEKAMATMPETNAAYQKQGKRLASKKRQEEAKNEEEKVLPNIVLIVADDMGYSDLGCYGGEIATPNIDRLAAEGMRFRNFYNDAKCGPSRAALLTGQYSHQGRLRVGATFAEVLRPLGYRTLMAGKWHQTPMPTDHGFDRYYGLVDGCCNFWNPGTEARPGEGKPGRKKQKGDTARKWGFEDQLLEEGYVPEEKNFYTTDAFTDYAVDRLEEYREEENPFLLYLAYTAPHYPLHAWPEDIAKYRDTYKIGWDQLRENRHQRMIEMGVIDESFQLSPRNERVPAWTSLSKEEQDEQAHLMAVYAAMIDRMDQGIGKVMAKLKEVGKDNNTMIIFLSDNGACSEPPNSTPEIPAGPVESYRSVGKGWANASNTPFRLFKATNYEGGTRAPLIVRWPGVTEPQSFSSHLGHLIDFVPTFMEITGAKYPSEIRGRTLLKTDGLSFLSVLKGKKTTQRPFLFWGYNDEKAVRAGDWKLVCAKKGDPLELYHLAKDPTELFNLADENPAKVTELEKRWKEWRALPSK